MNYNIKYIHGEPSFDALGVINLSCEAFVPVNERIYAQAQLGRNDDCLFVRIASFETSPTSDACLTAVLCRGEKELCLSMSFGGQVTAKCQTKDLSHCLTSYITRGEDLQGEYWAAVMLLPLETLFAVLGADKQDLPLVLSGNILRENPARSSAAPVGESVVFTIE